MNISTKWQKLVSLSPFDMHEYIFFPTITVYISSGILLIFYTLRPGSDAVLHMSRIEC